MFLTLLPYLLLVVQLTQPLLTLKANAASNHSVVSADSNVNGYFDVACGETNDDASANAGCTDNKALDNANVNAAGYWAIASANVACTCAHDNSTDVNVDVNINAAGDITNAANANVTANNADTNA